jgi:hypothetical protein
MRLKRDSNGGFDFRGRKGTQVETEIETHNTHQSVLLILSAISPSLPVPNLTTRSPMRALLGRQRDTAQADEEGYLWPRLSGDAEIFEVCLSTRKITMQMPSLRMG